MFRKYWKNYKNQNNDNQDANKNKNDNIKGDKKNENTMNQKIDYSNLTTYEKEEIKNFSKDKIYYCGDLKSKTLLGNKNYGFDNVNDCYMIRKNDHIYYRYKIEGKLGNGQYGNVAKVIDMKDNRLSAIKLIKNSSRHVDMCRQEIDILIRLINNLKLNKNEKEKIILIKKEFIFRNHLCIVTNLYYMNLYEFKCNHGGFSNNQIISISKDLFDGLKYLKYNNIIHADLKLENIFLYDSNANNVVIGDFGLSLYNLALKYNTNVQTIWYRSPEVLFNLNFDFSIDIWSLGAIIYELVTNKELFRAKTPEDLLVRFHEILGLPDLDYIDSSPKIRKHYNITGYPYNYYIKGRPVIPSSHKLPNNIYLKEIINGCLQWKPQDRIDYDDAKDMLNKKTSINDSLFCEIPLDDTLGDTLDDTLEEIPDNK